MRGGSPEVEAACVADFGTSFGIQETRVDSSSWFDWLESNQSQLAVSMATIPIMAQSCHRLGQNPAFGESKAESITIMSPNPFGQQNLPPFGCSRQRGKIGS
jgi:hypothetical protein